MVMFGGVRWVSGANLAPCILSHEVGPGCKWQKIWVPCWSLRGPPSPPEGTSWSWSNTIMHQTQSSWHLMVFRMNPAEICTQSFPRYYVNRGKGLSTRNAVHWLVLWMRRKTESPCTWVQRFSNGVNVLLWTPLFSKYSWSQNYWAWIAWNKKCSNMQKCSLYRANTEISSVSQSERGIIVFTTKLPYWDNLSIIIFPLIGVLWMTLRTVHQLCEGSLGKPHNTTESQLSIPTTSVILMGLWCLLIAYNWHLWSRNKTELFLWTWCKILPHKNVKWDL
jgi:hypothetical protein